MSNMKVVNVRNAEKGTYVYIGRGSKWGNPFHVGRDGSRQAVILRYYKYLMNNKQLVDSLHELKGKNLGCYCAPLACHGDILIKLANKGGE